MADILSRKYLALGDSYSIGEGVKEEDCFPMQLSKTLESKGVSVDALHIVARTGWTTDELWAGMQQARLEPEYDLVTLLIGVNNQYRGRSAQSYRLEFQNLLKWSVQLAKNQRQRVVVISIPDWSVTPYAKQKNRSMISREIDAFNAINLREAENAGVQYVNITQVSRLAHGRKDLLADDGLHPSALMYSYWVEKLMPVALKILCHKPDF